MMRRKRFEISAGTLLMLAALYFFDEGGFIVSLLLAIAVHELGHAAALRAFGARIAKLGFDMSGLRMDYRGTLTLGQELIAALSGPIAGALYAFMASRIGNSLQSGILLCSAGISAVLTAFNLLPAAPLDGGRAILCLFPGRKMEKALDLLGIAVSAALVCGGLYLAWRGEGLALAVAGLWLMGYCLLKPPAVQYQHRYL